VVDINTHSDLFGARTLAVQCYTEQVNENVNQRSAYRLSLLDSFAKIEGHSLDSIKEFILVARNDKNRTLVDRFSKIFCFFKILKSSSEAKPCLHARSYVLGRVIVKLAYMMYSISRNHSQRRVNLHLI